MGRSLTRKLIESHLAAGKAVAGEEIGLSIDQVLLTDGPFADTKEVIGGVSLVECADLDEALAVTARHPAARYGAIEIRPLSGT